MKIEDTRAIKFCSISANRLERSMYISEVFVTFPRLHKCTFWCRCGKTNLKYSCSLHFTFVLNIQWPEAKMLHHLSRLVVSRTVHILKFYRLEQILCSHDVVCFKNREAPNLVRKAQVQCFRKRRHHYKMNSLISIMRSGFYQHSSALLCTVFAR